MRQIESACRFPTEVLSCKWTLRIVERLLNGSHRTSDLQRSVPGITPKILHDRLRKLERLGLLRRRASNGYPLRVEYSLTAGGKALRKVIRLCHASGFSTDGLTDIVKCKWTVRLVATLMQGPRRASDLARELPGISEKVLFQRLGKLERLGLVERHVYPDRPIRVDYGLTPRGVRLGPLFLSIRPGMAEGGNPDRVREAAKGLEVDPEPKPQPRVQRLAG